MKPQIISIALIGHGAMGKELERLAPYYQCSVEQIFTSKRPLAKARTADFNFDVAIDFSKPDALADNVRMCAERRKNIVIGTTGWGKKAQEIEETVKDMRIGAVYGANFSVGVLMFLRIMEVAAELANKYDEYDVALHELHHRRKLDAPSGTALAIASVVNNHLTRKTSILEETSHGKIAPDALHVSSTRCGEIPGTHTVYIDSAADTLELTHRARNRSGFAIGALRAAQWVHGKQGFTDVRDVFTEF